jgi:hypothetical protein
VGETPTVFRIFKMKQLTPEQFKLYVENPSMSDVNIRKWCDIPDDKYYTVSVWPPERAGQVRIRTGERRNVPVKKISKSDAK